MRRDCKHLAWIQSLRFSIPVEGVLGVFIPISRRRPFRAFFFVGRARRVVVAPRVLCRSARLLLVRDNRTTRREMLALPLGPGRLFTDCSWNFAEKGRLLSPVRLGRERICKSHGEPIDRSIRCHFASGGSYNWKIQSNVFPRRFKPTQLIRIYVALKKIVDLRALVTFARRNRNIGLVLKGEGASTFVPLNLMFSQTLFRCRTKIN